MKYRLFLVLSIFLMVLQLVLTKSVLIIAPLIILVLLIRNPGALLQYFKFLLPSLLFLLFIYFVSGHIRTGLHAALILSGSSLSLQLYFSFFPRLSFYELLTLSGVPKKYSFLIYASLNYAALIKPLMLEIQDAQRIRGIEIPGGIRSLFYLPVILIPLMVKLLTGADHLAEALYLRSIPSEKES